MEAVFSLKPVREFSPRAVPESLVRDILRDVMHMPITGPRRPWQFVVINDHTLMERIPGFLPSANLLREAPMGVVVCYDSRLGEEKEGWFRDCTAAAEAILVVARGRNLGGICLSIHPLTERVTGMQRLLGLPDSIIPVVLVPLGFPREQERPAARFDGRRVHYNHW